MAIACSREKQKTEANIRVKTEERSGLDKKKDQERTLMELMSLRSRAGCGRTCLSSKHTLPEAGWLQLQVKLLYVAQL